VSPRPFSHFLSQPLFQASASGGISVGSESEKRLARPLALQVLFSIKWRDAGLGVRRNFCRFRIGETAREAARPPGPFQHQVEGRRPRRPAEFLSVPNRRNGSRGRSPSRLFSASSGGTPASASADFLSVPNRRNGSRGRSPSRTFSARARLISAAARRLFCERAPLRFSPRLCSPDALSSRSSSFCRRWTLGCRTTPTHACATCRFDLATEPLG